MSDYGSRLAASANSGTELGTEHTQFRPKDGNYYVSHTADKITWKLANNVPLASPIGVPVANVMDRVETTFLRKHEDYGPDNIGQSPFGPMAGIMVRLHDKMSRARHLTENRTNPNYESLQDTFLDMMGYCLAAILVLDGDWPGVNKGEW